MLVGILRAQATTCELPIQEQHTASNMAKQIAIDEVLAADNHYAVLGLGPPSGEWANMDPDMRLLCARRFKIGGLIPPQTPGKTYVPRPRPERPLHRLT
eukprot:4026056-Karenia_brevis.AAC.2